MFRNIPYSWFYRRPCVVFFNWDHSWTSTPVEKFESQVVTWRAATNDKPIKREPGNEVETIVRFIDPFTDTAAIRTKIQSFIHWSISDCERFCYVRGKVESQTRTGESPYSVWACLSTILFWMAKLSLSRNPLEIVLDLDHFHRPTFLIWMIWANFSSFVDGCEILPIKSLGPILELVRILAGP